jgi:corrinoid protein of di/trimethylamine methyltransferase
MESNLFKQMANATIELDEARCVALAQEALEKGVDPYDAIQEGYTKGMQVVGAKFAKLEVFLPEVMMAARAVNAAVEVLRPHLLEREDHGVQGTIVLGTIQGDLHDVGKNIVKIMLQASGFTVHDIGVDVPVRQFVDKAVEVDADIIAASAILTTTMTYMPDLIELLTELGLREKFRVMLGGAPVTRDWALEAGADGYGEDATEAVEVAKRLVQEMKGVRGA